MKNEFHAKINDADLARAYVSITEEMGACRRLLAFVDYDNRLSEELGLERDNLDFENVHTRLLEHLDPDGMESSAILSLLDDEPTFNRISNDDDFQHFDTLLQTADQIIETRQTLITHLNRRAGLLHTTSQIALESASVVFESLDKRENIAFKLGSDLVGTLVAKISSIVDSLKDRVRSLIDKIKEFISKLSQKAQILGKTIKAHPIKSLLIAVATIAAVAGIIYCYTQYSKGYSDEELRHYTKFQDLTSKTDTLKQSVDRLTSDKNMNLEKLSEIARTKSNINPESISELKKTISERASTVEQRISDLKFARKQWEDSLSPIAEHTDGNLGERFWRASKRTNFERERMSLITENEKLTNQLKKWVEIDEKLPALASKHLSSAGTIDKLLAEQIDILDQTKEELAQHTAKSLSVRRSMYAQIQNLIKGTFLHKQVLDGIDSVKLNDVFPPLPETKAASILGIGKSSFEHIASSTSEAFNKVSNNFTEFTKSSFNDLRKPSGRFNTLHCIKAVFSLIKDVVMQCISYVVSSVWHISSQLF